MLEIEALTARFGPVEAVRAVSLTLDAGELVAVLGPNGAGKTTLLRAVMGQHPDRGGVVRVNGTTVQRGAPTAAARSGLAIVPQGRRLFPSLTVGEHLDLSNHRGGRSPRLGRAELLDFFPGLGRRLDIRAGMLSGGEQQMLAIGRATLLDPSFVLMDEPTEGLSPAIVDNVAALVAHLPTLGVGVLLVDQAESALIPHARVLHMDRGAIGNTAPLGGST